MKKTAGYLCSILALACLFSTLCGCAHTAPSRFYTLSALKGIPMPHQNSPATVGLSVRIRPIEIPDYLDRPQIVTQSGSNELKVAEYDRWAGSLSQDIVMALRENISLLLKTERVFAYPWNPVPDVDYTVAVKILRLESTPGDRVVLKALWTITHAGDNREISTRVCLTEETLEHPGYGAIVAAMSRTFVTLSQQIASEIEAVARNPKSPGKVSVP